MKPSCCTRVRVVVWVFVCTIYSRSILGAGLHHSVQVGAPVGATQQARRKVMQEERFLSFFCSTSLLRCLPHFYPEKVSSCAFTRRATSRSRFSNNTNEPVTLLDTLWETFPVRVKSLWGSTPRYMCSEVIMLPTEPLGGAGGGERTRNVLNHTAKDMS